MNIISSIIIYFSMGLILFLFIEPKYRKINITRYIISFFAGLFGCLFFYFSFNLLGLKFFKNTPGCFATDSATYYLQAVKLVENNFKDLPSIITDHYHPLFLAIQMYFFGTHVLIPKIYQVLLFSISVVLWSSICRDLYYNKRLIKYFFYLLVTCVPLLSYTAIALKEITLFFATTVTFYGISKGFNSRFSLKNIFIMCLGILLMFMLRRQFALMLIVSFSIVALLSINIHIYKKILIFFTGILFLSLLVTVPFFSKIDPISPLFEKGQVFIKRGNKGRISANDPNARKGMIGSAKYIVENPLRILPMLSYGSLMLFFHPPFLLSPEKMIYGDAKGRTSLDYLIMGYYNAFFILIFPAIFFGFYYFYRRSKIKDFHRVVFLYFIFAGVAIIFASDSYRRFKISYFWSAVFLYIVYGFSVFYKWKKYIPFICLIHILLFCLYINKDLLIKMIG